jgi:phage FluMu protein Com
MLESGKDVIFTPVGQYLKIKCPTCRELMDHLPNVTGATCFAEAMSGKKYEHDEYLCKYAELDWHIQVKNLQKCAQDTPSSKLATIYLEESFEILKTRKSTKSFLKEI